MSVQTTKQTIAFLYFMYISLFLSLNVTFSSKKCCLSSGVDALKNRQPGGEKELSVVLSCVLSYRTSTTCISTIAERRRDSAVKVERFRSAVCIGDLEVVKVHDKVSAARAFTICVA